MDKDLPEPGSRGEQLMHRQIELQRETIALLKEIRDRMPAFRIVPIDNTHA